MVLYCGVGVRNSYNKVLPMTVVGEMLDCYYISGGVGYKKDEGAPSLCPSPNAYWGVGRDTRNCAPSPSTLNRLALHGSPPCRKHLKLARFESCLAL